jgi:cytoskeletal protein RodZ
MPRKVLLLVAVGLAGLTLVAAGCGGSSNSNSSTETTTEAASTEDTTMTDETTTEETMTDESTTDETTTAAEGSTDTSGSSFVSGSCKGLADATKNFSSDFTSGNVDFQKFADEFQQFADDAPSEIQGDLQTLADAYSKYADALQGVDLTSTTPDPEALQKLQSLSNEIDPQKLSTASQNVAAWVTKNCS